MKHKLLFRRFFASLLLCAVSTFCWAYDFYKDGIYYNKNSDGKSVTVTHESYGRDAYSGNVTIPSTVTTWTGESYNVKSIGDYAFSNCPGLTSVTIPNSVTSIGKYAFSDCSGLKSVTIGSGVTSIGQYAFSGCSSLTSITIPESVTSIGQYAFQDCSCLTSFTIPERVTRIGIGAFRDCSSLTSITIPGSVRNILNYTFYGCSGLTSVSIGNGVTSIGNCAFDGCTGLTSVTIGSSVTSIAIWAFAGCSKLTKVINLSKTPPDMGSDTFSNSANATLYVPKGCEAVYEAADYWSEFKEIIEFKNITFADAKVKAICVSNWDTDGDGELDEGEAAAVTSIGTEFRGSYSSIVITSFDELQYFTGLTKIDGFAFDCSRLTSISIPNNVTSIGQYAFEFCFDLTKAEFASIESLCNISFKDDFSNPLCYAHHLYIGGKEVKDVVIPGSVTRIGNYAFYNYSGLTSIDIPNSVTSIGENAFDGCTGLTSITIPESVTSIDEYAFASCSGLTSITIPGSVTSIGKGTFSGCKGLTSVSFGSGVTSIGEYAFRGCSGLTSVSLNCNEIVSKSYDTSNNLGTIFGSQVKEYLIGNRVKGIGENAFGNCTGLTSVTISESVASIGSYAFQKCSGLKSITIPNSVTSISDWAFYGCSALTSVTCLAKNVPTTGTFVFYDVPQWIATLYVPESSVNAYKAAAQWREFDKIVGVDPTGVEDLKANSTSETKADKNAPIYDLNGRQLSKKPASGYYIQGGKKYYVK